MAYPDDLLGPDEVVVVHKHPHWKMLIWPVIAFLLITGAAVFTASLVAGLSWALVIQIALGAVGLAGISWLTLGPLVRWRSTHFVVTSQRVMIREGVLSRTGIDIPLSRINTVQFRHGLIDRVFGCGTLMIESASDEPLEFNDIPDVERVHTLLYREVNDDPNDDFRPAEQ